MNKCILVVEDQADDRQILHDMLTQTDYLVERFLGSNHIRLHRRACRTRCGLQGSD
jgi:hypothetical protein